MEKKSLKMEYIKKYFEQVNNQGYEDIIEVGDIVTMIDNKMVLFSERDYTFVDSIKDIGSKMKVGDKRLTINGVPIIKNERTGKWYKEENFVKSNTIIKESVDFDDFTEDEIFGEDSIKIGDKVVLVSNDNTTLYNGLEFKSTFNKIGWEFVVQDIKFIEDKLYGGFGGYWYKLSCFEKIDDLKESADFDDLTGR